MLIKYINNMQFLHNVLVLFTRGERLQKQWWKEINILTEASPNI